MARLRDLVATGKSMLFVHCLHGDSGALRLRAVRQLLRFRVLQEEAVNDLRD